MTPDVVFETPVPDTPVFVENRPVPLKHVADAFGSQAAIAAEWQALNFTAEPDFAKAVEEYDAFVDCLERLGAAVERMPAALGVGLDSIYVRDAAVIAPRGVILCRMGKAGARGRAGCPRGVLSTRGARQSSAAFRPRARSRAATSPGSTTTTLAVGRGYRTNDEGIRQLRDLVEGSVTDFVVVPLPHWRGPSDVFHLMSMISPVDRDLAVVYSPLLPVPFRDW